MRFDCAIVGAGLMGSAAARHLADAGHSVVLIGPEEPDSLTTHEGVFASHYDAARITRKLDPDPVWARLATEAIARYPEIEQRGARRFFAASGAMMAGPATGECAAFIADSRAVAKLAGVEFEELEGRCLSEQFPFFAFPEGVRALYEGAGAGWINPRSHIRAELCAACASGVAHLKSVVTRVVEHTGHVSLTCESGQTVEVAQMLVASGAYSAERDLLPEPPNLTVYARTISFLRVGEAEVTRLSAMPSLVYVPPDGACEPYVLPPVQYPDGEYYLKIGGDPVDVVLQGQAEINDWFRSGGNPEVADFLTDQLLKLMPDLQMEAVSHGSCVTSFTPTGHPVIRRMTDRRSVLAGGNGAGAKCADELGRLGALLIQGKQLSSEGYGIAFE